MEKIPILLKAYSRYLFELLLFIFSFISQIRCCKISVCILKFYKDFTFIEDHQLHHCCWTGRVREREEEDFY